MFFFRSCSRSFSRSANSFVDLFGSISILFLFCIVISLQTLCSLFNIRDLNFFYENRDLLGKKRHRCRQNPKLFSVSFLFCIIRRNWKWFLFTQLEMRIQFTCDTFWITQMCGCTNVKNTIPQQNKNGIFFAVRSDIGQMGIHFEFAYLRLRMSYCIYIVSSFVHLDIVIVIFFSASVMIIFFCGVCGKQIVQISQRKWNNKQSRRV